jgi:polysaccharide export outer membrane protein
MLVGGMMLVTAAWSSNLSAQTPKDVSTPVAVPTAAPVVSGAGSGATPAAAAATTPAAPRVPTPAVSAYAINPGDELEIFVWGEERLQRVLRVLPDGTIAFPLVGQLLVQGRFPQDVEKMVSERLRPQYRGEVPFVTVSVKNPAGMQFSVMGRVRSPGSYTAGRYVNLLDALSLAGGPAEFANLDGVLIIRNQNGRLSTSKARLGSIFKGGGAPGDVERAGVIRIEPGDVVIVP